MATSYMPEMRLACLTVFVVLLLCICVCGPKFVAAQGACLCSATFPFCFVIADACSIGYQAAC
ncbi:hypothetical protein KP509_03G057400 [Ceratopteris richardii]|uniref:Uncharacterized protein n=1 Tax=Ceratopteris richardii TaxID=49495 RepID=A0A8T2V3R8_CERRI|nr:hypothetical protein KP509_03G057400 [Ceratopteris richardii]KAH7441840.1 hypothetical protein KP509_03G057400 [Ceratopteris richardii]